MEAIKKLNPKIFIVEDDVFYQDFLMMHFKRIGLTNIQIFSSGEEFFKEILIEDKPFLCILDYRIEGGMNGNQILAKLKKAFPKLPIILLSAHDTLNVAVQALKLGAYDYVMKDEYTFERIENLLKKIYRLRQLEREERQFKRMKIYFSMSLVVIVILLMSLNHYFDL